MSEKPVFTPRQHLDASINAIKNAYLSSPDPAHLVIAGLFEACQEKINYLHEKMERYENENGRLIDENACLHDRLNFLLGPQE